MIKGLRARLTKAGIAAAAVAALTLGISTPAEAAWAVERTHNQYCFNSTARGWMHNVSGANAVIRTYRVDTGGLTASVNVPNGNKVYINSRVSAARIVFSAVGGFYYGVYCG
jgi:hypothetical protein